VADIRIKGTERLKGTHVSGADIARGVDEIPVLALAGSLCKGNFSVSDAQELRHKESDRLQLITGNLKAAGAEIAESEDGFVIAGQKQLSGGSFWQTALDHRLAMAGLVASLLCEKPLTLEETGSTSVSYPSFAEDLQSALAS
jgi:3-phosphoshikimate 1-carboxyvinyltransferase